MRRRGRRCPPTPLTWTRRNADRSPAALTAREALHAEYDDIGRLAAYLGYDVIHAADPDFYVVLNRTAVRVQREDLR